MSPASDSLLVLGVGDGDLRTFLLLVGLRAADRDQQAAGGVEVEVLDVERDELGAPQRGGEPSSNIARSRRPAQAYEDSCACTTSPLATAAMSSSPCCPPPSNVQRSKPARA
jgi:hypothetical protein